MTGPHSVYAHVVAQLAEHRDGPFAFQQPAEQHADTVPFEERGDLILAEIRRFSGRTHRSLHTRLAEIGFPGRRWHADEHDFGPEESVAALARWLIRDASASPPLLIGLTMLRGRAGPEDADVLRHLAFLPNEPGAAAIGILAEPPGSTGHLLWIAGICGERGPARLAVAALCGRPEAVPWLLRHSMTGPDDWTGNAPRVARAVDLPRALREHGDEVVVVRNAAHILLSAPRVRTGSLRGGLTGYADAVDAYAAFAEVCDRLPVAEHGLIERVRDDLYLHVPALLDWPPGTREEIAARLTAVLGRSPAPATPSAGFRVETAGIGAEGKTALSVLVDGRPVLTAEFFATSDAWYLLDSANGLHARAEPHETELANGACDPECCGGLFVTIRKEGGQVIWDGWRQTMAGDPWPFPEVRFDAGEYEAELKRATRAHTAERVLELATAGDEQTLIAIAEDGPDADLAVRQLSRLGTPSAADWLRRNAIRHDGHISPRSAGRIADATDLATTLTTGPDAETVAGAARILLAMAMPSPRGALLLDRADALATWRALAHVAGVLEPVLVARLAVELRTGQTAALPWKPGEPATLRKRLVAALPRGDAEPWADRVLRWLKRPRTAATEGFHALSLERPPTGPVIADVGLVPLVDGVPVSPGVSNARLEADALPRLLSTGRTRIHSGECHDGCGATYADIRRDGEVITWYVTPSLESHHVDSRYRFEASAYEETIERARTG
ncbi:hypothetical protein [Phytomonospora endophytica]|uniref:Uncharacterized protein n=1 Tax=Phytomonospora endophytica TaxID=714109 RepID=A0A841FTJ8_9ACTN|nr:hypothetical protein [Phytomonospora endophytica]MBB6039114.1 hypothetical protein [Phytomonospora endophytica]GIG67649.1 hypothetical protein Pen01_39440 [Phytomonospora endophytica]